MLVSPERPRTKSVGRVWIDGRTVAAKFPEKDDAWRVACKKLLYSWSGRWERTFAAGVDLRQRAAELVHRLLLAGFIVDVADEVAGLALDASYEPESFRNVRRYMSGEYADWFCVTWARNEDLYGLATRLPGAHWDGRAVVVSREWFVEVLDFAEAHNFAVSDGARELATLAQQERDRMIVVAVPPLPKPAASNEKRPALPAPEFVEIDRELLDDEYDDSAT